MDALSWVLKDNYGIVTVKGAWRDRLSSLKLNFAKVKMIQKKNIHFSGCDLPSSQSAERQRWKFYGGKEDKNVESFISCRWCFFFFFKLVTYKH